LRVRKLFNKRCASVEEQVWKISDSKQVVLNSSLQKAAEFFGVAGEFFCHSLHRGILDLRRREDLQTRPQLLASSARISSQRKRILCALSMTTPVELCGEWDSCSAVSAPKKTVFKSVSDRA